MDRKIELKEQDSQPALYIRVRTSVGELPKIIGVNYMKIAAYLAELGEQPADAPFTAYHNLDMEDLDVEMGFPTSKLLPGKGEIAAREIPQGPVVSCMYQGPYADMEDVYNEMFKWMEDNNYESTGVYYEYYLNSPEEVKESDLLTQLVLPVKNK